MENVAGGLIGTDLETVRVVCALKDERVQEAREEGESDRTREAREVGVL